MTLPGLIWSTDSLARLWAHFILMLLQHNVITRIGGLERCTKLQVLRLDSNQITRIEGLGRYSTLSVSAVLS